MFLEEYEAITTNWVEVIDAMWMILTNEESWCGFRRACVAGLCGIMLVDVFMLVAVTAVVLCVTVTVVLLRTVLRFGGSGGTIGAWCVSWSAVLDVLLLRL